ncbi:hypothetical protein F6455_14810 [Proteobacteria bacterium 005FR1]|nr:hypothetical protein [Proteobacteria bacterium 005FR1]
MNSLVLKSKFLFRRELWENKGIAVWTPVALAGAAILLILLSLLFGIDDFSRHLNQVVDWGNLQRTEETTQRIDFGRGEMVASEEDLDWILWGSQMLLVLIPTLHGIAVAFEVVAVIVIAFYLTGTLFNDRKDRTILFWKSLPFSETHAVLVKLAFAALFIPAVGLLAALAVQLFFAGATVSVIANTTAFGPAEILSEISLPQIFLGHVLLVFIVSIKNLPLYSWLMFSSALSRKQPVLTAILPPLVVVVLEGLIFGTDYAASFIDSIVGVEEREGASTESLLRSLVEITPLQVGKIVAVTVPLIAATIWLRNRRFEL